MKQTLLVVVVSGSIGAAAATHFSSPAPAMRPSPQLDGRTLQAAMERALESVGFGIQARMGPTSAAAVPRDPVGTAEPAGSADTHGANVRQEHGAHARELPPANLRAIESARSFSEDETLRRTWLFRSERDVIAWLGTPDEVAYEDGGERWIYKRPDGGSLVAFFARGRLINVME
jgi:hypothetical protein